MSWYVQIVNGTDGSVEREAGPCSEKEAIEWERAFRMRALDSRNLYTRRYDEKHPPKPFTPPPIGTELTVEEFAKVMNGDRPPHMQAANLAFLRMTHRMLRLGGSWGWLSTETAWIKTEHGFKRHL